MITNLTECGSTNPDWMNEIHNIDQLDPDHNYICGLRPKEAVRVYPSKDELIGCGDYRIDGEALVIFDYLG